MTKDGIPGKFKNSLGMMNRHDHSIGLTNVAIALIAALLFIPFLGGVHLFDWDEINFAESAREMIQSGDYLTVQINYIPFWEKPPLFIWMQVASMKVFGINEFAARFPNAICGVVSLLILYNLGRKLIGSRFGLLWVLFYTGSLLPFFYFKSGIIDPWFNLCIFLGVYFFYEYLCKPAGTLRNIAGSSFFIGLAILTKGPVALLIFMLTAGIFILLKKFKVRLRIQDLLLFTLILAFTGGFWFILQIFKGNLSIITDFIVYQIRLFRTEDAGHGGFLLYHFAVLFAGVFPASIFALPALFGSREEESKKDFYRMMLILFWVVLLLFTIVRTKIVHYSSLCYFPLTFIAAWSFHHALHQVPGWKTLILILILTLGTVLALAVTTLTFIDHFKNNLIQSGWVHDPFAQACLLADGAWKGYEFLTGLLLFAGVAGFFLAWQKNNSEKGLLILTGIMPLFILVAMLLIVPRVEAYSQRAAIDFFSSVSEQDAYLETIGYKSYAHLFYGRAKHHTNPLARDEKWLLTGPIDKTAYFSLKINKKDKFMQDYPDLELLYEKNGFVFFKRTPNHQK
jgi:4-amino-4-deoxy-L-arabinose transferase-like glycosyltransferase